VTIPLPGDITVEPPGFPTVTVEPPTAPVGVLVPVEGPVGPLGPVGPPGLQGPAGDAGSSLSYVYTTSNPAMTHQINHGLNFKPAGIVCLDSDGAPIIGFSIDYVAPGIVEISFGSDVTPTIYLS
jgi:hypothetical protein